VRHATNGRPCRAGLGVLFSIDLGRPRQTSTGREGATGKNPGYERKDVEVIGEDGGPRTAATYIALRTVAGLPPYHWYKALVWPVPWSIACRRPISSGCAPSIAAGPGPERRAENEALLFEPEPGRDGSGG